MIAPSSLPARFSIKFSFSMSFILVSIFEYVLYFCSEENSDELSYCDTVGSTGIFTFLDWLNGSTVSSLNLSSNTLTSWPSPPTSTIIVSSILWE
ncbi:hypothetical protein V6N13_105277 [Hibiscus sabdariffa]|uniref:Uncharacterized protein n=1 Tax=Hibiscus sabdariffa TaxID=183260 RepID=A0ABR2EWI8_9ROSI